MNCGLCGRQFIVWELPIQKEGRRKWIEAAIHFGQSKWRPKQKPDHGAGEQNCTREYSESPDSNKRNRKKKILGWKKHTSLSHETCFLRKFQQQFFEDVATTPPERPARESESLNSSALLSHKRLKQELILWYPLISSDPNPASHNKQTLEPSVSL